MKMPVSGGSRSTLIALGVAIAFGTPPPPIDLPEQVVPRSSAAIARSEGAFVRNLGQWPTRAEYHARFGATALGLHDDGWVLGVWNAPTALRDARAPARTGAAPDREARPRGATVRMRFVDASTASLVPEELLTGTHTYLLGPDPKQWRTGVPRYRGVRYLGLYPGVEVLAYGKDAHFEYDLNLAPGATLANVRVRVEGAIEPLRLDADGALLVATAVGTLRQPKPVSHVVDARGEQHEVACEYEVRGSDTFGFVAPNWSGTERLVLDPGLIFGTYLGGTDDDTVECSSVDASGVVTLAGSSLSLDFPTTPGAWDRSHSPVPADHDAFVARLDPRLPTAQQLLYSTFLGGNGTDVVLGIHADTNGVVTATGWTSSPDFPTTTGAFDRALAGMDAFVLRLDPSRAAAQQLTYSTFVGGSLGEIGQALAVSAAGVVTVTGSTNSPDFPTTNGAFSRVPAGSWDAFVCRVDPLAPTQQQLLFATFLGGEGDDYARTIAVDSAGVVTVGGQTGSATFPTTPNAFDRSNTDGDGFLTRIDPARSGAAQLVYSTFVGGSLLDSVDALFVDASGVVTAIGLAGAGDFPTTPGAYGTTRPQQAALAGFVIRLDPQLPGANQLLYSTFLGATQSTHLACLQVDPAGVITVAGVTSSKEFPVTPGAYATTYGGGDSDAFVSRLDPRFPGRDQLVYSTFCGGSRSDTATGLHVDANGVATLVGWTSSTDLPTTPGAWNRSNRGGFLRASDAFVLRLDLLPVGARSFGTASPGCSGPLGIGISAQPSIEARYEITCHGAPPSAPGLMLLAPSGAANPFRVLGVDVWLDLTGPWFLTRAVTSDSVGGAHSPLRLLRDPRLVGARLAVQFVWFGPAAPPPCPPLGVSTSNALEITLQP